MPDGGGRRQALRQEVLGHVRCAREERAAEPVAVETLVGAVRGRTIDCPASDRARRTPCHSAVFGRFVLGMPNAQDPGMTHTKTIAGLLALGILSAAAY